MKNCKICGNEFNTITIRGAKYAHNSCPKCRSKQMIERYKGSEKRKIYIHHYVRRIGRVKEYPCEYCGKLCYKKYAHAFCSDICRFMSYVKIINNCWIWIGSKNRKGYGRFCYKGNCNTVAHRVSYLLFKGEIIKDKFVCHSCDNPSCVKPEHLWLGNHPENMIDMARKCRAASKLSIDDVKRIRDIVKRNLLSKIKIAKLFNISSGHLTNIINKRIWKYVKEGDI